MTQAALVLPTSGTQPQLRSLASTAYASAAELSDAKAASRHRVPPFGDSRCLWPPALCPPLAARIPLARRPMQPSTLDSSRAPWLPSPRLHHHQERQLLHDAGRHPSSSPANLSGFAFSLPSCKHTRRNTPCTLCVLKSWTASPSPPPSTMPPPPPPPPPPPASPRLHHHQARQLLHDGRRHADGQPVVRQVEVAQPRAGGQPGRDLRQRVGRQVQARQRAAAQAPHPGRHRKQPAVGQHQRAQGGEGACGDEGEARGQGKRRGREGCS